MNTRGVAIGIGLGLAVLAIIIASACQHARRPCCSGRGAAPVSAVQAEPSPAPQPTSGASNDREPQEPLPAGGSPVAATPDAGSDTTNAASPVADAPREQPSEPDTRVIAYYFHRTMRCATCLSIEKQARKAVETMYPDQLAAGKLEWHAVNIEEPGNEHFETDFELESSSLVLVQMRGDKVAKWANLPRVWDLAHDPAGFQEYVWTELAQFAEF